MTELAIMLYQPDRVYRIHFREEHIKAVNGYKFYHYQINGRVNDIYIAYKDTHALEELINLYVLSGGNIEPNYHNIEKREELFIDCIKLLEAIK